MQIRLLVFSGLLFTGVAAAQTRPAPRPPLPPINLLHTDFDGTVYNYRITYERADTLPDWQPADGTSPPVRVDRAIAIATRWMKAQDPRFETFLPWRIELQRVAYRDARGPRGELWHYIISADAGKGTERIFGNGRQAVILMDGSVVEPIAGK
jgi:hypothetical protein